MLAASNGAAHQDFPWNAGETGHLHATRPTREASVPVAQSFEREADFQRHLPMRHFAVDHVATGFGDAELVDVAHRFMGLGDRLADRVFDAQA